MAITGSQFVVSVGSPSNQAGNEAMVSFCFNDELEDDYTYVGLTCAAFIAGCGQLEGGSYIAGVTWRPMSLTGAVNINWDATNWANLHGHASYVPELDGFGDTFGTDGPIARGLGMTLLETTPIPGRSYTGRTYIPCISAAAMQSNGLYSSVTAGVVQDRYNDLIIDWVSTISGAIPVVRSTKLNLITPITGSKVMLTPCRLRSRQR